MCTSTSYITATSTTYHYIVISGFYGSYHRRIAILIVVRVSFRSYKCTRSSSTISLIPFVSKWSGSFSLYKKIKDSRGLIFTIFLFGCIKIGVNSCWLSHHHLSNVTYRWSTSCITEYNSIIVSGTYSAGWYSKGIGCLA